VSRELGDVIGRQRTDAGVGICDVSHVAHDLVKGLVHGRSMHIVRVETRDSGCVHCAIRCACINMSVKKGLYRQLVGSLVGLFIGHICSLDRALAGLDAVEPVVFVPRILKPYLECARALVEI